MPNPIDHSAVQSAIDEIMQNYITGTGGEYRRVCRAGIVRVLAPMLERIVVDERERAAKILDANASYCDRGIIRDTLESNAAAIRRTP